MRQWSTCVGTPEKFSEHMEYSVCLIEQLLYCLLGFLGRGTTSGILLYLSLPTLAPFFFICPQWLHTHDHRVETIIGHCRSKDFSLLALWECKGIFGEEYYGGSWRIVLCGGAPWWSFRSAE
ncbi:hypothetical protein BDV35DRAFT_149565 [Aspergillus flavus]|uniref:Uncharacterized protein n=1 Tax=Aspergillus flavus TaxID=5059 RepID=A0A5N6H3R8_ASPFL|nr:hypothetical protein BDV35DRAFT_149565 [Aspergillus flavus]